MSLWEAKDLSQMLCHFLLHGLEKKSKSWMEEIGCWWIEVILIILFSFFSPPPMQQTIDWLIR